MPCAWPRELPPSSMFGEGSKGGGGGGALRL